MFDPQFERCLHERLEDLQREAEGEGHLLGFKLMPIMMLLNV